MLVLSISGAIAEEGECTIHVTPEAFQMKAGVISAPETLPCPHTAVRDIPRTMLSIIVRLGVVLAGVERMETPVTPVLDIRLSRPVIRPTAGGAVMGTSLIDADRVETCPLVPIGVAARHSIVDAPSTEREQRLEGALVPPTLAGPLGATPSPLAVT